MPQGAFPLKPMKGLKVGGVVVDGERLWRERRPGLPTKALMKEWRKAIDKGVFTNPPARDQ